MAKQSSERGKERTGRHSNPSKLSEKDTGKSSGGKTHTGGTGRQSIR